MRRVIDVNLVGTFNVVRLAAIEDPMLNGEVLRLDGAVRTAPR